MKESPRLFLIGLDGGTFRVITPAIQNGKLPSLKQLIETGASGVLTSTIPPATLPAFPTLMTGMNPGKHGIFDFMQPNGVQTKLVDGTKIRGQTLWRTLSDQGKRCIVINVPLTYPPEEINGIIVSGMMTPDGRSFTHPANIAKHLEKLTAGYPVRFDASIAKRDPKQFLNNLYKMIRKRRKTIQYFLEQEDWDLFVILFRATDIVQHHSWRDQNSVIGIYENIDKIIGDLLKQEPKSSFFIFSDHGFGPLFRSFHVNIYLRSLGLLSIKTLEPSREAIKSQESSQPFYEKAIKRFLNRIRLTRAKGRDLLPSKITRIISRFLGARIRNTKYHA